MGRLPSINSLSTIRTSNNNSNSSSSSSSSSIHRTISSRILPTEATRRNPIHTQVILDMALLGQEPTLPTAAIQELLRLTAILLGSLLTGHILQAQDSQVQEGLILHTDILRAIRSRSQEQEHLMDMPLRLQVLVIVMVLVMGRGQVPSLFQLLSRPSPLPPLQLRTLSST